MVMIDEAAKTAAGQPLVCLFGCRQSGMAADMLDRNRIAGGEGFLQRFVEPPFLASPRGICGFVVHGGSVARRGVGGARTLGVF